MADFLSFTLQKPQIQQQQGTNGVDKAKQNQQNQQTQKNDQLKKTDVFTAAKNGMQAQNQQQNMLAGGDSGFGGVNAFGDSGFGDTVSFSTKATDTVDTNVSKQNAGKTASVSASSNENSDIAQIAKEIGVEANESAVKNKLASMGPEELNKIDDDTVKKARELGLVSLPEKGQQSDNMPPQGTDPDTYAQQYAQQNGISVEEAKAELKEKYGDPQQKQGAGDKGSENQSVSTGAFAGKTMSSLSFANNDAEIKQMAEELGVEADEGAVKNKLNSMNPQELVKLSSDTLDNAADIGLISMSDIEKKIGASNKSNNDSQKGDEDPSKKIKFGTFTSGSEV